MIRAAFALPRFIRTQFLFSRRVGFGRCKSTARAVGSLFSIY